MLDDVLEVLACPHCGSGLTRADNVLRCVGGHDFDIAKQGYVNLMSGGGRFAGDTAEMVARRSDFLDSGHFAPILDAVAHAVSDDNEVIVDMGAGPGHYLAGCLDRVANAHGIAVDVSKYASRRAAKAHPRMAAVVADAWSVFPIRSGAVSTMLDVFAPRNPAEMSRVLRPGGRLVVVTPHSKHLRELVEEAELISIDEQKQQRLDAQLQGLFGLVERSTVEFPMVLRPAEVRTVIAMGPSSHHLDQEQLDRHIAALPDSVTVTASVAVSVHQK